MFYREGMGYTTSRFARPSTRSPASTASTSPSASSCWCRCCLLSLRGKLPEHRSETVEVVGLYWHFVDVVWIVIFAVVYLIP